MVIGTYRRFVAKEYVGVCLLRHFLDLGEILGHPVDNKRLILLKRPPNRTLKAETKFVQHSPHRDIAQTNIKFAPDQLPHHASGPKRKGEFQLSRASADNQAVILLQRYAGKFRRTAAGFGAPQRLDSTFPVLGEKRLGNLEFVFSLVFFYSIRINHIPACSISRAYNPATTSSSMMPRPPWR